MSVFDTQLYCGNGNSQTIQHSIGSKPDLVWVKRKKFFTEDPTNPLKGYISTWALADVELDWLKDNGVTVQHEKASGLSLAIDLTFPSEEVKLLFIMKYSN